MKLKTILTSLTLNLILVSAVAAYTINLRFQDGAVEVCNTNGVNNLGAVQINGEQVDATVNTCNPDVIFTNGFEATSKPDNTGNR